MGVFSQYVHGFVSMNWNLILWKGPKTPSQTFNHIGWVFGSLKINTMDRVVLNDGPPFLFHIPLLFVVFWTSYQCKILSGSKKEVFLILENKNLSLGTASQIERCYFPNLLFPKQNESQRPQVDWDFLTGGAAVVASGTLRGRGGGTLRRRPLWLSTLLSTSPWSARTKLGVATAVLVLYQTFSCECWLSFVKFWKTGWETTAHHKMVASILFSARSGYFTLGFTNLGWKISTKLIYRWCFNPAPKRLIYENPSMDLIYLTIFSPN